MNYTRRAMSMKMKDFVCGIYSKKLAIPYLLLMYAIFITFILISIGLYPGSYHMNTNAVSNLGNMSLNPYPGWLFFSIALWTFGILSIPHVLYQYRLLSHGNRAWAKIFLLCSFISSIGSIGVGIFSENQITNDAHVISAGLAFGGLFIAAMVSWIPGFGLSRKQETTRIKHRCVTLMAFLMVIIITVAVITGTMYVLDKALDIKGTGIASITLWEWMLLFSIGIHTFLLTIILNSCIIP